MTVCLAEVFNPLVHVVDHAWYRIGDGGLFHQFTLLSNHVIMTLLAAALLLLGLPRVLRKRQEDDVIQRLTPTGFRNLIELICQFLRDQVARPNLGSYTDRYIGYVWTAFFFILTCNLLGLLPLQALTKPLFGHGVYGAATGNIFVTATLAVSTLVMIVLNGLRVNGFAYVKHFFMGPFPVNVLIAFLEVIGLAAKTFALAVRLFANMCAGHILLAVLVSFISMAGATSAAVGVGVAVPVVIGSVLINMLEIFVAFLQAFIFTFLSCVFIGQAVNIHHDEGPGDEAHAAA